LNSNTQAHNVINIASSSNSKGTLLYKMTNPKGPKEICVSKTNIIPLSYIFNPTKKTSSDSGCVWHMIRESLESFMYISNDLLVNGINHNLLTIYVTMVMMLYST